MKSLKAKFRKTDVNEWNKNDERLLAAVEHGEVEKVASLLAKKGASAVKLDGEGKSALHVAAARGQTDCLSVILAHGADLSITDATGYNPLHLAAKNNHVECCKKLIQSKCPIDGADSSGKAALHHAAASGNIQTVQLLCELKSPINLKDADGLTPLLLSAKHAHAEVCSTLLDCGAEINASDNSGRTALMLASESSAVSVVEVLVQRGADLSAIDSQGRDVLHYSKLSGNSEVKTALAAALNRQQISDAKSPRSPQHDQVAKLSDERITTPKKRKAPPPPISPLQSAGPSSPSAVTSTGTPASNKSDTPKTFSYKEDEVRGTALKDEVEKLHDERNMLLETIEDLKQTVEQTGTFPELDTKAEHSFTASAALVSALQAKITALTLENQQLAGKLKKYPSVQGGEDLKETSRPSSMASNASFHSTQDEFESLPQVPSITQVEREGGVSVRREEEESEGSKEEIRLLRQALENVQIKLLETRKENRSLHAQLKPERGREREEYESVREKGREEELMESLAELQAKLTDTQERYHQAVEEVDELREQMGRGGVELMEKQEVLRRTSSTLEHEVKQLKAQLVQSGSEQEKAAQRIRQLEEALRRVEEERRSVMEKEQRTAKVEELYKEAQEEIGMLQEALRGTVPVEAAAKDFEEMKAELNEVIAGMQRRLLELSHSYSETKSQLSAAHKQLAEAQAESTASSSPSSEQQQQVQVLNSKVEELQTSLADTEKKHTVALEEILLLKQEAEVQAQGSVSLADHTQVMSSLGNAIKELESQSEALKEQLHQKTMQVEALQSRLTAEKDVTPDDSVSRVEHETTREQLEGEVNHLTQLLQGALRKQDEMALEAADAWQKARENRAEREALQELVMSREKENQTLTSRLAESQDAVSQLKQLVENHVASEREKNKRIDDLSREVGKLKDALNSLSQLSYTSGSPSKRLQQNQQLETLQQQIKQLQYQLSESKKQHHEIVSVYRMHLLYAVQGQMDEDVQKALKQILMMCKMPSQTKETC
ncbi:Ankycorbin Ankyrin repeat and coiled-coil structure-containing protein [Collichthys lucidus]|uniref:Ankycorbin Ankyrin repeat and coiled-coil structure-containing protein n=1 Tax=Collichthys lucidus TaxID=240159 RepID=A0A4U5VAK8_COLLU|nr:Ankycorbin Ankyrin repeat and coiled-coil structure-containing protein [Collichthys lucidus]